MKRSALLLLVLFGSGILAEEVFLPGFDPSTRIYVIRPGDTLWDLAGKAFQDPWKWPRIWFNNPKITNPHRIYPGDPLVIPEVGKGVPPTSPPSPETTAESPPPPPPSPATATLPPPAPAPSATPSPPPPPKASTQVEELPPLSGESVLESRLTIEEKEVPELPPGIYIRLGNEGIVDPTISPLPNEILGGIEEDREIFSEHDLLYLSNPQGNLRAGDRLYAYRDHGILSDPETGKELGRWIVIRGVLEVRKVEEKIAQAVILKSFDSIEKEDLLLPYRERTRGISPRFNPLRISARIVALPERHTIVGPYQVVYIGMGSQEGVREGDFVEIFQMKAPRKGKRSGESYPIPPRAVGRGVVIELGTHVSTVLVVSAESDIGVGDIVVTAPPRGQR